MSAAHFPPPPDWAHELLTVGVTGTNGKTSTTRWIAAALATLGRGPVARVTTVGSFVGDEAHGGRGELRRLPRDALGVPFPRRRPSPPSRSRARRSRSASRRRGPCASASSRTCRTITSTRTAAPSTTWRARRSSSCTFRRGGAAVLNAFDETSALLREVLPEGVRLVTYGVPSRSAQPDDARAASVDALATSVRVSWEGTEIALAPSAALGLPASLKVRAIGEIYAENALAALCAAVCAGADRRRGRGGHLRRRAARGTLRGRRARALRRRRLRAHPGRARAEP